MEQKEPQARGRPRGFDTATAVAAARNVFWTRGFAVPLDQIAVEVGLHKPSIYAAFGGKQGLYLAALDAYLRDSGTLVAAALDRSPLREALTQFFDSDLDVFLGGGPRGCFMLSTALLAAQTHPDIAERLSEAMKGLKQAITSRIAHASASGDIPRSSDVEALSDIVLAVHIALSARVRAGEPRHELRSSLRGIVTLVAGESDIVPLVDTAPDGKR